MKRTVFQITRCEYADQEWLDIFEDRGDADAAAAAYNRAHPTCKLQSDLDYLQRYGSIDVAGVEVRCVDDLPQSFWLPSQEKDHDAAYVVERVFYPRGSWQAEQEAAQR